MQIRIATNLWQFSCHVSLSTIMLCLALELCAFLMTSFPSDRDTKSGMERVTLLRSYLWSKVKKIIIQIATNK